MKRKLLLLMAFVLIFATGCKKTNEPKDETKTEVSTEVQADEKKETKKVENKEEEEKEDAVLNFDSLTGIKLPIKENGYELTDINGKKYIQLSTFRKYMLLSKNRFDYEIKADKNEIKFKTGLMPKLDKTFKIDTAGLEEQKFTLKQKQNTIEGASVYFKDDKDAFVDIASISKVLEFNLEKDEIIFADADALQKEKTNDRDYDWYMDQAHTGEYSDGNCGPTSLAMILKWLDGNSAATGESLRNEIPNDGDWWTTNIFDSYFENKQIDIDDVIYTKPEDITNLIDKNEIVLVCLSMGEILPVPNPDKTNMGRFYKFDGGHFLLIKGYKIIDDELYYEVYDPNNWDMTYSETGEPMGKDRLYKATEMHKAIVNWWSGIYGIKPASK